MGPDFVEDMKRIMDAILDKPDMEEINDTPSVYGNIKVQILTYMTKVCNRHSLG